jgi:formylglycine-generating enzyme required for sulfatase activity
LGRGIVPELEVTAAIPENEAITQSYQWYKNDDNNNRTGRQIAGATGAKYRLTALEAAYEGTVYFYCAVTNSLNGRTTVVESGTKGVTFVVKERVLGEKSLSMTDIPAGTVSDISNWNHWDPSNNGYYAPWSTPGFTLGTYEVTYELWKVVFDAAESGGYSFSNVGNQGADQNSFAYRQPVGNKFHPVTLISWNDTVVWCNAYSEMDGKEPVYVDSELNVLRDSREPVDFMIDPEMSAGRNGYRLPTHLEWEYAARGANPESAVWNYSMIGTNEYGEIGDYYWTMKTQTKEVGAVEGIKPNSLGLYDMGGNLPEAAEMIRENAKKYPYMGSYFNSDYVVDISLGFCRLINTPSLSLVNLGLGVFSQSCGSFRIAMDN